MKRAFAVAAVIFATSILSGCMSQAPEPKVINCQDPGLSQAEWTRYCHDPARENDRDSSTTPTHEGETNDSPPTEFQPFDGGFFTWPSGVTVTTTVEVLEPWGEETNSCEGCLHLMPDDLRFVLRYTISVPGSYAGGLNADRCSGSLETTSGNDDEALTFAPGNETKVLSGTILPGKTKFGVTEFGISKDYAEEEFVYVSSCGDPVGYESGIWGGPLPEFTTDQPSNVGERFSKNTYFQPQVTRVRQVGSYYLVHARTCMLAVPPGFDDLVPVGPGYAWTVVAEGKKIGSSPDSKLTTFNTTEVYVENPCATGWIAFRTSGMEVSKITYLNDEGDKGVWE